MNGDVSRGHRIVIGSRGSDLALTQSRFVAAAIEAANPGVSVYIEVIHSKADKLQDVPLAKLGGKGLFTKELEVALLEGDIDLAVHSLKDLPTELPEGLCLAAIPERENPHDALISRHHLSLQALPKGAVVGTSSLRRKVQLLALRPDLQLVDLRGNVPTRIAKLERENLDAIVLAMAGLRRLGLDQEVSQELTPDLMLSAPAQGALGIEARSGDGDVLALLQPLHHEPTAAAVTAERALLRALGGGCQTPVGALAWHGEDGLLHLRACIATADAATLLRAEVSGDSSDPVGLGERGAQVLYTQGGCALPSPAQGALKTDAALAGRRVVVTRSSTQASKLSEALRAAGAEVIEFPTISVDYVQPSVNIGPAAEYDWLILTSANAVEGFAESLAKELRSTDEFRATSICAIGPATAEALRQRGLTVELTPAQYVADAIAPELARVEGGNLAGKRILMPRGNLARPELPEAMRTLGADVIEAIVYQTSPAQAPPAEIESLALQPPDYITFTSSSTVTNFCALFSPEQLQNISQHACIASIGPVTSGTCAEHGMVVAVESAEHTIPGLVKAIVAHAEAHLEKSR